MSDDTDALMEVFRVFDRSGDGHITRSNLLDAMEVAFGDFVTSDEIDLMLDEADTNKNGTIEATEFRSVMVRHREDPNPHGWGRLRLYNAIGGLGQIKKIVDKFYEKVLRDPALMPKFIGVNVKGIVNQ
jgi:hypothetical protein